MEEWKLAYLAGIIDGEGTITIAKSKIRKGRKNHLYSLRMSVGNSDKRERKNRGVTPCRRTRFI